MLFEFFEKPISQNIVLQCDTALSESKIRPSFNQEVVRWLLCCSSDLAMKVKQEILSIFSQKLLNLGFSLAISQLILVHVVSRYLKMVRCSRLSEDHPQLKPLYWDKSFNRLERNLSKFEAKSGRYSRDGTNKSTWRQKLPAEWKGSKFLQHRILGMDYSGVFHVQVLGTAGC